MTALRLLAAAVVSVVAWGHDPITTKLTWSKEISRIFLKRCMTCHQAGDQAPFALTLYEQARPWAVAIRDEVAGRTMPPWSAVKGFGEYKNDPSLSQEEISLIVDWVNGGAPEGDPQFAPEDAPKAHIADKAVGKTLRFGTELRLAKTAVLTGLRPRSIPEGGEVRVVLERPDGTVEPLAWLRKWRAKFARDLVFREPVMAPAGSVVRAQPVPAVSAVTFDLVTAARP